MAKISNEKSSKKSGKKSLAALAAHTKKHDKKVTKKAAEKLAAAVKASHKKAKRAAEKTVLKAKHAAKAAAKAAKSAEKAKSASLEQKAKAGMKRDRALAKEVTPSSKPIVQRPATIEPSDSWTVVALRARARKLGLPGYSRMTKAELLDTLRP